MPPIPRFKQLTSITEDIQRGLILLPNSSSASLGLNLIQRALGRLRDQAKEIKQISENSYTNSAGVRHHLFNVSLSLENALNSMEESLSILAEAPENELASNDIALQCALIRTVKLAPKPKALMGIEDMEDSLDEG